MKFKLSIDSIKARAVAELPAYKDVVIVALPTRILGIDLYGIYWARPISETEVQLDPIASLMEKAFLLPRMRRALNDFLQSVKNIETITGD